MPNNIENVLFSDNHFLSNRLVFAGIVPSSFFLRSYIYDFDSVCVFYLFLVVFVMIEMECHFFSPLLFLEGMIC